MKRISLLLAITLLLSVAVTNATPIEKIDDTNIKYLVFGKTNKYVKQLQEFLNENGFNDCDEGPGSPGNETEMFGICTQNSIKIFQEYYNIQKSGIIDSTTAQYINNAIKEYSEDLSTKIEDDLPEKENPLEQKQDDIATSLDDAYSGKEDIVDTYKTNTKENYQDSIEKATVTKDFFPSFFESITKTNNTKQQVDNQRTYKSIIKTIWNSIFKK